MDANNNWREEIADVIIKTANLISYLILFELDIVVKSQGVLTKVYMKLESTKIEREVTPYIGAVMFLSFNGKEVTRENVITIIRAIGIEPNNNYLNFISSLNLKNNIIAYAPVVYYLKVVRKEVTLENVLKVISAMGVEPDEEIGKHVLKIYSDSEKRAEGMPSTKMEEKFMKTTQSAALLMGKIMITELDRTFEHGDIDEHIKNGFIPYLAAVGTLVYAGKDVNIIGTEKFDEYISKMVTAVGFILNKTMLDYISSFNYGNSGFPYVSGIYYLISVGKELTSTNLMSVVTALGIKTDEALAGYILTIYKDYAKTTMSNAYQ